MSTLLGRSQDQVIGDGFLKACGKQGCPQLEHGLSARCDAHPRELMSLPARECPLVAQSGHSSIEFQCPFLGVKRTWAAGLIIPSEVHCKFARVAAFTGARQFFAPYPHESGRDQLHVRGTAPHRCADEIGACNCAIRLQKNCCSSAERHLSGE